MPAQMTLTRCRDLVSTLPAQGGLRADDAALYLAHTTFGAPLRRLAEAACQAPSTILRAVRRVEQRRDDPLLDDLLARIEAVARIPADIPVSAPGVPAPLAMESLVPEIQTTRKTARKAPRPAAVDDESQAVEKEARRILRRLSEPRAFLALARGAQVACVFRKSDDAFVTLARTTIEFARDFAARDWIGCVHTAPAMVRYEITAAGRAWLKRTLAEDGDIRRRATETPGLAEAPSVFARQHQIPGARAMVEDGKVVEQQVNLGETPLGWLARRKGSDGKSFLAPEEFAAGERLREDFERAQMGPRVAQDWSRFLTPRDASSSGAGRSPSEGPTEARRKLAEALEALGPGLNDVALRACCFLEGLEATERRMGWSARSGKVVLKIALQRLAEHYGYAGEKRTRNAA